MTEIQHNESFALYAFPKFITSSDRFWNQQYKIVKATNFCLSFTGNDCSSFFRLI